MNFTSSIASTQYEVIVDIKTSIDRERIISIYVEIDGLHTPMYILQAQLSDGTWIEMDRHRDIDLLKNEMSFVRRL